MDEKSKQLGEQSCQHGKGGLGTGNRRGKGQEEAQALEVFGSKSGGAAMVWDQGHDGVGTSSFCRGPDTKGLLILRNIVL